MTGCLCSPGKYGIHSDQQLRIFTKQWQYLGDPFTGSFGKSIDYKWTYSRYHIQCTIAGKEHHRYRSWLWYRYG